MNKLFLIGLFGFSVNAMAETHYVNADILNIRNYPVNGEVVGQLSRGESIEIYQSSDDGSWVNLSDDDGYPMWVSGKYLCVGEGCYQQVDIFKDLVYQKTKYSAYQTSAKPKASSAKTQPVKKQVVNSYSGSCPCSGSYNCTGPRGGKYCYTNSGTKRYR